MNTRRVIVLLVIASCTLIILATSTRNLYPFLASTTPQTRLTQSVPGNALVITNGLVIDGTGAAPISDGLVVIMNRKILAVGRAADYAIPPETKIIDAQGGTIMPGMINSHVHEAASPLIRQFYFLHKGVTTVCDLGTPLAAIPGFKNPVGYGLTARGFFSGPIINAPNGYPGTAEYLYPVTSPDEARQAVSDLVGRGADMIKIALDTGNSKFPWTAPDLYSIPIITLDELKAIVQQAHASNKLVRVHIGTEAMLDLALDGGVDVLEHIPLPNLDHIDFNSESDDHFPILAASYEAKLARAVQNHVVMVPTLDYIIKWCESFAMTNERKMLCRKFALTPVQRFHQMGGVIGLGDDSGFLSRTEMPIAEMQRLAEAGLTPMEIIQAGTQTAARVCGHGVELGTLEPGKLADILIVSGNPLTDIRVMNQVRVVILGGQVAFSIP